MTRPNLDDADPGRLECGNCGETDNLLRCSRCRTAWYCCRACQKSHWPFHREDCRSNAFADAIEDSEPKFASWLRRHGKQAALRDGDVERLEHASQAACSPVSRRELMDSMWGKADPSPAAPRWTREDEERMAAAAGLRLLEKERENGRAPAARAALRAWSSSCADALLPPPVEEESNKKEGGGGKEEQQRRQQGNNPLGRDSGSLWRWWQTPTRVEVVVNLFEVRRELRRRSRSGASSSSSSCSFPRRRKGQHQRVEVSIGPQSLSISLLPANSSSSSSAGAGGRGDEVEKIDLLSGALLKKIAVDGSTWHVADRVLLHVSLLKLSRRGCYLNGDTAAETWWRSVFAAGEGGEEREKVEALPTPTPTTATATTTALVSSSSSSSSPPSFLKLPEPLPASAPLCYYALPRDPDDEGAGAERVATRKKK